MTADELDREYARQLTAMAAARVEHENPRHLRLMARETRRRRGAEILAPEPGAEILIWADLHFDEERMRRVAERPWPAVEPMNAELRRSWREAMAPGATMVCAGDIGGYRTIELQRLHEAQTDRPDAGPYPRSRPKRCRGHAARSGRLMGTRLNPSEEYWTWVFSDPHFGHEASVALFGRTFRNRHHGDGYLLEVDARRTGSRHCGLSG